jgi:hypothetical protein
MTTAARLSMKGEDNAGSRVQYVPKRTSTNSAHHSPSHDGRGFQDAHWVGSPNVSTNCKLPESDGNLWGLLTN